MKDLSLVSESEVDEFLNSFDYVLCDVDGVLWTCTGEIPGAKSAITSLQAHSKIIKFITNNNTKSQKTYFQQFQTAGYNLTPSALIQPVQAIIAHLRKLNFSKEIYLIGMTPIRTALEEAGFKIAETSTETPFATVAEYIKQCFTTCDKVGAVIVDIDLNMTMAILQKGAIYLENPNILFITAGSDEKLTVGNGDEIIGPGVFHKILEGISGKKPVRLAKPSAEFGEFVKTSFGIKDGGRVLFIGDSVTEDMGFAETCGFQKLLVFSGITRKDVLKKSESPLQYKPHFYADSLKTLDEVLKRKSSKKVEISKSGSLDILFNEDTPRAIPAITHLQSFPKSIKFICHDRERYQTYVKQLNSTGYNITRLDLVQPVDAIISYLKELNFYKEIYLIGMTPMRTALEQTGFKIAKSDPVTELDTTAKYVNHCTSISGDVEAVIAALDLNLVKPHLQKCAMYIKNPKILFIAGERELKLTVEGVGEVFGPGFFLEILEEASERKALNFSINSVRFVRFVMGKFNIGNASRVLVLGDFVFEDAGNSEFQRLLVLNDKVNTLKTCEGLQENKPQYYINNLKSFENILTQFH